jgi:hydroxyacylglutathione hydrolase
MTVPMTTPFSLEVAPGVLRIPLFGTATINAYLVGDVLIDAGIRGSTARLEAALAPHKTRAHALTHVHSDHQGASHFICQKRNIPLWVHHKEAPMMEQGDIALRHNAPDNVVTQLQRRFWAGPAHNVARGLQAGDDINGFEVLETPGHAQGHISYWRESDRVLIIGDVLTNMNIVSQKAGLHEPLSIFTLNAARNRQNIHFLAALEPKLVLFGHGKPLRDPEALLRFAATLT